MARPPRASHLSSRCFCTAHRIVYTAQAPASLQVFSPDLVPLFCFFTQTSGYPHPASTPRHTHPSHIRHCSSSAPLSCSIHFPLQRLSTTTAMQYLLAGGLLSAAVLVAAAPQAPPNPTASLAAGSSYRLRFCSKKNFGGSCETAYAASSECGKSPTPYFMSDQ